MHHQVSEHDIITKCFERPDETMMSKEEFQAIVRVGLGIKTKGRDHISGDHLTKLTNALDIYIDRPWQVHAYCIDHLTLQLHTYSHSPVHRYV